MNEVLLGDCLELMKSIPDKSIDMILCDLPYGTTACKWDTRIPLEPLWEQYKRIIKKNGAIVLTASQPFTSVLVMSNIEWFRYEWIWHKNLGGGFATCNQRPMKRHENLLVFYQRRPIYNPQYQEYNESTKIRFKNGDKVNRAKQFRKSTNQINAGLSLRGFSSFDFKRGKYPESVQYFKSEHIANFNRLHPTQKPVALFEYLIKTYTNEGDLVLDNCAGSGTTGIACKNLKRSYILIEKDENYCKIIQDRLDNHIVQGKMEVGNAV